tara:strand:- start:21511 stop:21879 length:369 start_codon:yes stop_codon:yes gene_type:complete
MTELKPCPFCGGKPYLANVAMVGCAYIVCTDCRMQSDDGSQKRVIDLWNTRAEADTLRAEVKRLRLAMTDVLGLLDDLVTESGRSVEYDEEDAFRRGEWFDDADTARIEAARAALAHGEADQ